MIQDLHPQEQTRVAASCAPPGDRQSPAASPASSAACAKAVWPGREVHLIDETGGSRDRAALPVTDRWHFDRGHRRRPPPKWPCLSLGGNGGQRVRAGAAMKSVTPSASISRRCTTWWLGERPPNEEIKIRIGSASPTTPTTTARMDVRASPALGPAPHRSISAPATSRRRWAESAQRDSWSGEAHPGAHPARSSPADIVDREHARRRRRSGASGKSVNLDQPRNRHPHPRGPGPCSAWSTLRSRCLRITSDGAGLDTPSQPPLQLSPNAHRASARLSALPGWCFRSWRPGGCCYCLGCGDG